MAVSHDLPPDTTTNTTFRSLSAIKQHLEGRAILSALIVHLYGRHPIPPHVIRDVYDVVTDYSHDFLHYSLLYDSTLLYYSQGSLVSDTEPYRTVSPCRQLGPPGMKQAHVMNELAPRHEPCPGKYCHRHEAAGANLHPEDRPSTFLFLFLEAGRCNTMTFVSQSA